MRYGTEGFFQRTAPARSNERQKAACRHIGRAFLPLPFRAALAALLCVSSLLAAELPRPTAPPFSVASILQHPQALARPHDVEVHDRLMFVPGKGGSIAIIDVGDPARPRLLWWTRHPEDDAQTVLCHDGHLLVGTRDFFSIDITQPRQARICKRLRDRPRIDRINGMILWGDHVLYANKLGWIGAVDVSRPGDPVLSGALNTRKQGEVISPHDIAAYKNCVIVVDQRDGSPWKVRAYRVADPRTGELLPVEQWRAEGAVTGERLNGANRAVVRGDYVLIACNKAGTLAVVDFCNLSKPATLTVLPFPGEPCGLTLAGNVLFAAGGQAVQALDVSDPRKPVLLATYESLDVFPTKFARESSGEKKYTIKDGVRRVASGNAHDLVYQQGYLYVTAQSDDQIAVLRVDDPQIRRLADQPPSEFGGSCIPVEVENPVTMSHEKGTGVFVGLGGAP